MAHNDHGPLAVEYSAERWPLSKPFRITGRVVQEIDVLLVRLHRDGFTGQGEATGVFYRPETAATMAADVKRVCTAIESGIDRTGLQTLLPPSGARNALDCAFWDLEAQEQDRPARDAAGIVEARPLLTTFTCGADSPAAMAAQAQSYGQARALKLKLTGEAMDAARVHAVRDARPDVWLGVDANQGLTPPTFERLLPTLVEAKVMLLEQPFPVNDDAFLDRGPWPLSIAADESALSSSDIARCVGRYDVVNIKLDKSGGLTEGLAMNRRAAECGLRTMVGNMMGTSLSAAPAFLLGQSCELVDLDGPIFLASDRAPSVVYQDGFIACPESMWGTPRNR